MEISVNAQAYDDTVAPVLCPISPIVLEHSSIQIREYIDRLNGARHSGSRGDLQSLRSELEKRPVRKRKRGQELLAEGYVQEALLGDCLSILGRWLGDEDLILVGTGKLIEFLGHIIDVEKGDRPLPDNGETLLRAHTCAGNAYTREAYAAESKGTLTRALKHFRKRLRNVQPEQFMALEAAHERDKGDCLVGQLFWDHAEKIDGAAIRSLHQASGLFARKWAGTGNIMFHGEWAAAESSLAVAYAWTAYELRYEETPVTHDFLGLSPKGKVTKAKRAKKAGELIEISKRVVERVWRAYLWRLDGCYAPPGFRWANPVSSVGQAASAIARQDEAGADYAALAEAAFLSLIEEPRSRPRKRLFRTERQDWRLETALESGVHYTAKDHPGRLAVNIKDLQELYRRYESK